MLIRFAFLILASAVFVASVSPASAQAVYYGEEPMAQAPSAPPPDQVEAPPPPPGPAWVWKPGHWRLKHNKWVWEPGKYIAQPSPAAVWVPDHWVARGYGYVFVPGHWL